MSAEELRTHQRQTRERIKDNQKELAKEYQMRRAEVAEMNAFELREKKKELKALKAD